MDVVLKKIHYNPECFSKIVEDFEDYVEHTHPGVFQKTFDNMKKTDFIPEEHLICAKIQTKNMEHAISVLKNDPECYLNDFDEIKKLLEGADAEEKAEEWLDELPCHLNVFYNTVIGILFRANWQKIYYSPEGYWKGIAAIKKLAEAAKVPEEIAKTW